MNDELLGAVANRMICQFRGGGGWEGERENGKREEKTTIGGGKNGGGEAKILIQRVALQLHVQEAM